MCLCVARVSAKATYFPIVVGWNVLYIGIRVVYQWSTWTMVHSMASIVLWILTYVSYNGILDQCENAQLLKNKKREDTKLEGGAWLDLLGLVALIQFGTTFLSSSFYWFLLILPIWGIYKLYQTFYGNTDGDNDATSSNTNENEALDEATKAKRKKRAEKRRQKWS